METRYFFVFFLAVLGTNVRSQTPIRTGRGIQIKVNAVNAEIQVYSPSVIRVLKNPDRGNMDKKSISVTANLSDVPFRVIEKKGYIELKTSELIVRLNRGKGTFEYFNTAGKLLLSEQEHGCRFSPVNDQGKRSYNISQSFKVRPEEAIYGLGQHQQGIMNYRNKSVTLIQKNTEIAVPFIFCSGGTGIFWDNYSATEFSDENGVTSFKSEIGDVIDYYFIYGHHADGVIAGMRMLTGQAPLFPKWVFGFWQSRERYRSSDELLSVVKRYRELKVPLDGIVQDWQYWGEGENVWNAVEFGNPLFPDPRLMVDSVHKMNAHMIISVWPNFGKDTKIYSELNGRGGLYDFKTWPESGSVKVYDAFNPEARNIYWKYINKNLFSIGMDGWWLDATEPEQLHISQSDSARTFAGSFKSLRNAYPLVTTSGVYENQRKTDPSKRVFILTRSAFAGQQRNATIIWSGDIQGTWDVFRKQISAGLNLSLSGIPYWNTDIGGFYTAEKYPKGIADPAFYEIYTRWLEFAVFTPMFRSHGTSTPREIYQFGKDGDWAYDAQKKFINLRYRLIPYIYSTAWQVTKNSSSMMRALVMDFPSDKNVYDINNQYLFGKSVLVAPVSDSMYTSRAEGKTKVNFGRVRSTKVYLPAGAKWVDFWSGKYYAGGKQVDCIAPIDQIPLFVRCGSILPLGPFQQFTSSQTPRNLELRVYGGADGKFVLYEDETDNYNYEKGVFSTIEVSWNDAKRTLTIHDRKGAFPGMPEQRFFDIVLVSSKAGTGAEPSANSKKISYSGKEVKVAL